jgi:hypothetical protein
MKRNLALLLSAILLAALALPTAAAAASRAAPPRVVVVVGPSGEATDGYRRLAEAAAKEAARYTTDVVRLYSPYATWPIVKKALQGASIVIYLGHGNGWPSRYRDSLYPPTQNGMGLNPVAGVDDETVQYFGEAFIARDVKLAPNAAVLMHRLCYASGNTEPGLPEGTIQQSRQRVDNYAAGWLAAGARAVIAEGHSGPQEYVRAILGTKKTLEAIWRGSRMFNDNVTSFKSKRTPGAVAMMDPKRESSGFYRSIVLRAGLRADQVQAGARAEASVPIDAPLPVVEETLASIGAKIAPPALKGMLVAGTRSTVTLPVTLPAEETLPTGLMLGVRWYPLDVDAVTESAGDATASGDADASATPGDALDDLSPIRPEVLGAVVEPQAAKITKGGPRITVTMPKTPGLYRLVTTLHDEESVALDAASQALVPGLIVRVSGTKSAAYAVDSSVSTHAGAELQLPVGIVNTGSAVWGAPYVRDPRSPEQAGEAPAPTWLVGRWVPLTGTTAGEVASVALPLNIKPRERVDTKLSLSVPRAGAYLLILDVTTPEDGSLAAAGADPAVIHVTVGKAADAPKAGSRVQDSG